MKVYIKTEKINQHAKLPTRAHQDDTGFDLYASEQVILNPWETKLIPIGIKIKLPATYSAEIRPRSGLSLRTPLKCLLGTLDNGYRGEINAILINLSNTIRVVNIGDRVAQLVVRHDTAADAIEVDSVGEDTDRGQAGFGSTGR